MTSRASLTSLPIEIVTRIASFSDRKTFIALRQVAPGLLSLDRRRLWEQLFLTLPRHFAAQPYVLDSYCGIDEEEVDADGNSRYRWYLLAQAVTYQAGYCLGLREKVKRIFRLADGDAWSMVKAVTMAPQPTSVHPMMLILDLVSPNLESLTIEAAPYHPHPVDEDDHFPSFDLDLHLLDIHIRFPSLTHLQITSLSSCHNEFCVSLIRLAPNLLSLDLSFNRDVTEPFDQNIDEDSYTTSRTKLRRLRLSWDERAGLEDYPAAMLFLGLLAQSPDVREVVISFGYTSELDTEGQLGEALGAHEALQDLRWPLTGVGHVLACPQIKRLASGYGNFSTALQSFPHLLGLEELFIGGNFHEALPAAPNPLDPDAYPGHLRFHDLASDIRRYPSLRSLRKLPPTFETDDLALFERLDDLTRSEPTGSGVITSLRCGDEELVQLRYMRRWRAVEYEHEVREISPETSAEYQLVEYRAQGTALGEHPRLFAMFRREPEPVECTLTDYKGHLVPLEVIAAMKEVTGSRVENWDRRGVEVEADVWQVLEDWYTKASRGDRG